MTDVSLSNDATHSSKLRVESWLQINIAVLIVLSTVLLAMGQQNLWYGLVALVAAIMSLALTDLRPVFRLGPNATTAAAVGACLVLVVQVVRNADESQLLNVANILIYLEIILLFQRKEDRTYWSLMTLSLLQVIVAAALNLGLSFGFLLGLYVLVAISAMTLFYALRATRPFEAKHGILPDRYAASDAGSEVFRGDNRGELASQVLNRPLFRRLVRMVGATALVTVFLFFAIPRYSSTVWENEPQASVATVGFTEEVRLDDLSRILESSEQVMRVEFTELDGSPYHVDGDPYFRGTVLSDYKESGFWRQFRSDHATGAFSRQRPLDLAEICIQRVTLQMGSHSVLFNVAPAYPITETPNGLRLNSHTRQLTLSEDDVRERGTMQYALGTSAFRNGWQRDLVPVIRDIFQVDGDPARAVYDDDYWRNRFPGIFQVASSVIADQGLQQANTFEKAKALEAHFRTPRLYRYALEMSQDRDPQLDPIEDFVANHRTGHCEYFASALTLMLRSQKIPARMVVGYKGGDFNTVGHYYIVRQLHAHAWVEAYIAPDQIPDDEKDSFEDRGLGAWLRLDPTPDGIEMVTANRAWPLVTTIREVADYCQVLWDDYVLGLNATRQQEAIYDPINRSLRSLVDAVLGEATWPERWEAIKLAFREMLSGRWLRQPLSWLVLIAVVAIVWFRRYLWRALMRLNDCRIRRPRGPGRARFRVEVYERLAKLLARHGFRRAPQQTQLEFASAVGRELSRRDGIGSCDRVPLNVTEAFYRIRFGGEELTRAEFQALSTQLLELEAALKMR